MDAVPEEESEDEEEYEDDIRYDHWMGFEC